MKKEDTGKALEAMILDCKRKMRELLPLIDDDIEKSKEYNKIVVQKAILVDRYKKLCFKPSLKARLTGLFKKREKLICDYFLT